MATIDFEKEFGRPNYQTGVQTTALQSIFKIVYGWMTVGLVLSGVLAWYTATSSLGERILMGPGFTGCLIAEIVVVLVLGMGFQKLPAFVCTLLFLGYAALNGLTLAVIFYAYELSSIAQTFYITAGMFLGLVLWGTFTKGDLTSIGSICGMALWGLILAGIVNMFVRSSGFDLICSFAGVLIFTGLTMYDAQKIKLLAQNAHASDAATIRKVGIMGALNLYLDFINLFLHILRFLGKKR